MQVYIHDLAILFDEGDGSNLATSLRPSCLTCFFIMCCRARLEDGLNPYMLPLAILLTRGTIRNGSLVPWFPIRIVGRVLHKCREDYGMVQRGDAC